MQPVLMWAIEKVKRAEAFLTEQKEEVEEKFEAKKIDFSYFNRITRNEYFKRINPFNFDEKLISSNIEELKTAVRDWWYFPEELDFMGHQYLWRHCDMLCVFGVAAGFGILIGINRMAFLNIKK